jgi:alkylation response protein AidB-like acyl-CoA dehydrogenase
VDDDRAGDDAERSDEEERRRDEAMLVATVREFVDKEVRPTVCEVEHAGEYPEAWIEQMKRIGIYVRRRALRQRRALRHGGRDGHAVRL